MERKHGWQLAEHLGAGPPGVQRLLDAAHWAAPVSALLPLPIQAERTVPASHVGALIDAQWHQRAPLLPVPPRRRVRPLSDLRQMITAMLWVEQTGCSWRALPEHIGPWQDVYERHYRWRQTGLWRHIRRTLQQTAPESAHVASLATCRCSIE